MNKVYLDGGDVGAHVHGVATGVRWVSGRARGHSHGQQEGLLAALVTPLVVRLDTVQQFLRDPTEK